MKFSIVHPTARVTPEFEHPWWLAAKSAFDGCDNPGDVEYILVVHQSRLYAFYFLLAGSELPALAWGRFTVAVNRGRDCLVDQCNAGQIAASGEIFLGNQDDMRYPEHWDTEVSKLIPNTSEPLCVQAHTDGSRKDLLTIPTICTRPVMEQIGLLSDEYESMFSDDEWSMKAHRFAGIIPSTLYFQHLHPANGTAASDSVYELENRPEAYRVGHEAFERRRAAGFPRVPYPGEDRKPISTPALLPATDMPILALCFPGDNFSGAWLDKFFELGSELRELGYLVKRFRGYRSNVYSTRIELTERVIEDAKISGDRPKYVLWIDHDNVADGAQLRGLIKFLDHYSQVDAVAGWCWIKKAHGWTTSAGMFWPEDGVHLMSFNLDALFEGETAAEKFGPKRIEHTGFPFMLMRFEALDALGPHAFRPLTKADLPAYFEGLDIPPKEVADHWFCGEDSAWCLQAKKAGMTIVVDPGCKVGHLKLQLQEPLTMKIADDTPAVEAERSIRINGEPVTAPPEYERVS